MPQVHGHPPRGRSQRLLRGPRVKIDESRYPAHRSTISHIRSPIHTALSSMTATFQYLLPFRESVFQRIPSLDLLPTALPEIHSQFRLPDKFVELRKPL